jgi:hypothetical protein
VPLQQRSHGKDGTYQQRFVAAQGALAKTSVATKVGVVNQSLQPPATLALSSDAAIPRRDEAAWAAACS